MPAAGETVGGGTFLRAAGGKGANQAVAARRASRGDVVFVAAVGDDDLGREAMATLEAEGFSRETIRVVPGTASGVALILVDAAGENAISVAPGANARFTPEDLASLDERLWAEGGVFLASLEIPVETVAAGVQRARRAGMQVIVNPAPAVIRLDEAKWLADVDVLTPNETELAQLCRDVAVGGGDDEGTMWARAETLVAAGVGTVIVTRGRRGCAVVNAEGRFEVAARTVEAVDTTGAGDAFNGALAAALAEGMRLRDAAEWATAAAAVSVTRMGAIPSMPTREEVAAAASARKTT